MQPLFELGGVQPPERTAEIAGFLIHLPVQDHDVFGREFIHQIFDWVARIICVLTTAALIMEASRRTAIGCSPSSGSSIRINDGIISAGCRRSVARAAKRSEPSEKFTELNRAFEADSRQSRRFLSLSSRNGSSSKSRK